MAKCTLKRFFCFRFRFFAFYLFKSLALYLYFYLSWLLVYFVYYDWKKNAVIYVHCKCMYFTCIQINPFKVHPNRREMESEIEAKSNKHKLKWFSARFLLISPSYLLEHKLLETIREFLAFSDVVQFNF